MVNKNFSKSTRIHIRNEKARIRRTVSDPKEQERLINELYLQSHIN
jgi:hypothetical protein